MERTFQTRIGPITIEEENKKIIKVSFEESGKKEESPLLKKTEKEIKEYLNGTRKKFTIPIHPKGSEFQQKVWKALEEIPYGETRSYGEIAEKIGNPKSSRAVGQANNKNPISIIIPCHRVIGKNGDLTGYGGGLDKKIYLLELEEENMEFKELKIDNNMIHINVEEEKWIRIRHDKDLEKALEDLGNLPIAQRAKEEYKKTHGKDIQIETNSLAVEISGHVLPGDLSYKIQELNLGDIINKGMEEIQSHTDIIDCGEKDVDGNRFIWDKLQLKPLIQDKRKGTS